VKSVSFCTAIGTLPLFLLAASALALGGCRGDTDEAVWMVNEALGGSEEELTARCGDDEDNDLDGLFDCDDPDCAQAFICTSRGPEPLGDDPARCFDGVDNDENGYVDCGDYSCLLEGFCRTATEEPEASVDACTDGLDNDWDDDIDCEDTDCMTLPGVDICEASDAACSDGVDNDKDGFVDCGDWSCSQPAEGVTITVCD
jgi:hypothetical protein